MNTKQIGAFASIGLDLMLKGELSLVIGYVAGIAKVLEPYAQSADGLAKIINVFDALGIVVSVPQPRSQA